MLPPFIAKKRPQTSILRAIASRIAVFTPDSRSLVNARSYRVQPYPHIITDTSVSTCLFFYLSIKLCDQMFNSGNILTCLTPTFNENIYLIILFFNLTGKFIYKSLGRLSSTLLAFPSETGKDLLSQSSILGLMEITA